MVAPTDAPAHIVSTTLYRSFSRSRCRPRAGCRSRCPRSSTSAPWWTAPEYRTDVRSRSGIRTSRPVPRSATAWRCRGSRAHPSRSGSTATLTRRLQCRARRRATADIGGRGVAPAVPGTAPGTKLTKATRAAVMSTTECGANQNPRKMTLPVMFATKTWPSTSTLTASTSRWRTSAAAGTRRRPFRDRRNDGHVGAGPLNRGVRSKDVIAYIRVINHCASRRSIVSR